MGDKDPLRDFLKCKQHLESQINCANAFITASHTDLPRHPETVIRTTNGSLTVPPKLRTQMLELGNSLKAHYRSVQLELEEVERQVNALAAETKNLILDHGRIKNK